MSGYLPVVIYLALIVAFGVVSLGMAMVLRPARPTATKLENYECGAEPIGQAWVQFPVGFYLVALVFIVFDALAVFLFPWALVAPRTGAARRRGHGDLSRLPVARLALRATGKASWSGSEGPCPADSAAAVWTEFKDLQEWEKYHQSRAEGDKHSALFETITDGIHHFPGGFLVTTVADRFLNWARKSSSGR